jgi:hypothetical protein
VRLGFPGFTESDRQRMGEVLDALQPHADTVLRELTGTERQGWAPRG